MRFRELAVGDHFVFLGQLLEDAFRVTRIKTGLYSYDVVDVHGELILQGRAGAGDQPVRFVAPLERLDS